MSGVCDSSVLEPLSFGRARWSYSPLASNGPASRSVADYIEADQPQIVARY
jgi:hypothetical protein